VVALVVGHPVAEGFVPSGEVEHDLRN
jgi:hypothetical protein